MSYQALHCVENIWPSLKGSRHCILQKSCLLLILSECTALSLALVNQTLQYPQHGDQFWKLWFSSVRYIVVLHDVLSLIIASQRLWATSVDIRVPLSIKNFTTPRRQL